MSPKKQQQPHTDYYEYCHTCEDGEGGATSSDHVGARGPSFDGRSLRGSAGSHANGAPQSQPSRPPVRQIASTGSASGVASGYNKNNRRAKKNGPAPTATDGNKGNGRRASIGTSITSSSVAITKQQRPRAPPPPKPAQGASPSWPPPPPARRRARETESDEASISSCVTAIVSHKLPGSLVPSTIARKNSGSGNSKVALAGGGAKPLLLAGSSDRGSKSSHNSSSIIPIGTKNDSRNGGRKGDKKSDSVHNIHVATTRSPVPTNENDKSDDKRVAAAPSLPAPKVPSQRGARVGARTRSPSFLNSKPKNENDKSEEKIRAAAPSLPKPEAASSAPKVPSQRGARDDHRSIAPPSLKSKEQSSSATRDRHHRSNSNNKNESTKAIPAKHSAISSRVNNVCNEIYDYLDKMDAKNSQVREGRRSANSNSTRPHRLSRSDNTSSTSFHDEDLDASARPSSATTVQTSRDHRRPSYTPKSRESSVSPFEGAFNKDTATPPSREAATRSNRRSPHTSRDKIESPKSSPFEYYSLESSFDDQDTTKSFSRRATNGTRKSSYKLPLLPASNSCSFEEEEPLAPPASNQASTRSNHSRSSSSGMANYRKSTSMPLSPPASPRSSGTNQKLDKLDSCASFSLGRNSSAPAHLTREENYQLQGNFPPSASSLPHAQKRVARDERTNNGGSRGRSRGRSVPRRSGRISNELNSSITKKINSKVRDIASSTRSQSVDRMQTLTTSFKRLSSKGEKVTATLGLATGSTRSMASMSTDLSDCDSSIVSAMRSFQGGKARRRGSSLSRNAQHALDTLTIASSVGRTPKDGINDKANRVTPSLMDQDDSRASMMYDVPYDPLTGRCNYHPSVCMAIKMEEEKKSDGKEAKTDDINADIVGGWKIVRTTCPKCTYGY